MTDKSIIKNVLNTKLYTMQQSTTIKADLVPKSLYYRQNDVINWQVATPRAMLNEPYKKKALWMTSNKFL